MAERPTFLFVGENVADGLAPARVIGGAAAGVENLPWYPLDRREEDYLRSLSAPTWDWYQRHVDANGIDVRPMVWNQAGIARTITSLTDQGDGTTRLVAAADAIEEDSAGLTEVPIQIRGVAVTSGADPNGVFLAARVDSDTFDLPGEFDDAGYAFASSLVTASGGRTITITRADAPPSPFGTGLGFHYIDASSGDFLADGFRPEQNLEIGGTAAGSFNTSRAYRIASVEALRITIRDEGTAGFHTTVAGVSSNLTLQGFARAALQSFDTYLNPFAGFAGRPNGITEQHPAKVGMYPSNRHGIEAGFFPEALDDPSPPTDDGYEQAPAIVQARGDLDGSRLCASMLHAGSASYTIASAVIVDLVKITLTLDVAALPGAVHPWGASGTVRLFVTFTGAGYESLTGWQTATVETTTTVSIPVELSDSIDPADLGLTSAYKGGDEVLGVTSIEVEETKTLLNLQTFYLPGQVHPWGASGTVWLHVQLGPGFEALSGYRETTIEDTSTVSIAVVVDPATLPDVTAEPYYGREVGTVAARDLELADVTPVVDGTEIQTTQPHGLSVGDWITLGNLAATYPINGAHEVLEVVDLATFRVGVIADTPSDFDEAWIAKGRRWAAAYDTQASPSDPWPHNGGSALEFAKLQLRGLWHWFAGVSETSHLAGIVASFGAAEDPLIDLGTPGADIAKTGTQINRFWMHAASVLAELRTYAATLADSFSFPVDRTGDPTRIPAILVRYSADQTQIDDPNDPGYVVKSQKTGRYISNSWLIREQTQLALRAAGGRVGMVDPFAEGWELESDGLTYTPPTMMLVGENVYRVWRSVEKTGASASEDDPLGVPVYGLIGQSQTQGWVEAAWLWYDNDPNYNGEWMDPATGGVIPGEERQCWIWNHTTHQFEEYYGTVAGTSGNGNTHPIQNELGAPLFGPEASLIRSLRERHPQGVYLLKLARHAASIQNNPLIPSWDPDAGDLYADLLKAWADARRWLCDRDKVPDFRGFVYDQGEGDTAPGYYESYAEALDKLLARVRIDFQTRVDEPLPIVIGRLMDHDRQVFPRAGVDAVRAAQDAKAASDPNIVAVDLDSVPILTDDIHRTGRGAIRAGLLLGEGFDGSLANYDHPKVLDFDLKPFDEDGFPSEGGAGVETAESTAASSSSSSSSPSSPTVPVSSESVGESVSISSSDQVEVARQIVAACDAAILTGVEVLSYTVNGRTVTRHGLESIQRIRTHYDKIVRNATGYRRSFAEF